MTAEIFSHFLPQDPLRTRPGPQSPTLLCQVCRKWRDIAISSPRLWKSLQLDLVPEFLPQQLQVLRTWLTRSGHCPLSIGITYKAAEPGLAGPPVDHFVRELMLHSKRWQSMEINLPFEVLHLIEGEMPRLFSLTIGPNAVPEPPTQHPLRLFHSSPNLEHIVLSRFFQPSAIQLCWENCTNLEGLFLYVDECVVILTQAVNIVRFKATIESGGDTVVPVPALVHLESLLLLPGETEPDDSQMRLLDALKLPALQNLRVSELWFTLNPAVSISKLISRSGCHIRELRITESRYDGATWWCYLIGPKLHHLESKAMESIGQIGEVMLSMSGYRAWR